MDKQCTVLGLAVGIYKHLAVDNLVEVAAGRLLEVAVQTEKVVHLRKKNYNYNLVLTEKNLQNFKKIPKIMQDRQFYPISSFLNQILSNFIENKRNLVELRYAPSLKSDQAARMHFTEKCWAGTHQKVYPG